MKYIFQILLILFLTQNLFAQQGGDEIKEKANSNFDQQRYFEAITEYKRYLYFINENDYESNYKIGVSYKNGKYYENAIKYISLAQINSTSINQKYDAVDLMIRCNILRGTYERAHQLIKNAKEDEEYKSFIPQLDYWTGWVFIYQNKWDKAYEVFNMYKEFKELAKLCYDVDDSKYSVTFAKLISYILPGVGQFYTGNYIPGFISLGWNVLWGYNSIIAFNDDRIFDGIMISGLLWLRFLKGSSDNAENLAIKENELIINNAFRYLQYNFKGIKP